eukprot:11219966-Lingulodinium_polyedra.AAC.1
MANGTHRLEKKHRKMAPPGDICTATMRGAQPQHAGRCGPRARGSQNAWLPHASHRGRPRR